MSIQRSKIHSMCLILLASILFSSNCFAAKQDDPIAVGYTDFHPLAYTKNGTHQGILLDIMRKVAKAAHYQVSFFPLRAKHIGAKIESGKLDLWLGLRNHPAVKKGMTCGELDVYELRLKAYTINNRKVKSIKDLKRKNLILLRGYGYGGDVKFIKDRRNRNKIREANSHAAAFRMLKRNPNAYVIDYKLPSQFALKTVKVPRIRSYDIESYYVRFCVSKKLKNAPQIVEDLESALSSAR